MREFDKKSFNDNIDFFVQKLKLKKPYKGFLEDWFDDLTIFNNISPLDKARLSGWIHRDKKKRNLFFKEKAQEALTEYHKLFKGKLNGTKR